MQGVVLKWRQHRSEPRRNEKKILKAKRIVRRELNLRANIWLAVGLAAIVAAAIFVMKNPVSVPWWHPIG